MQNDQEPFGSRKPVTIQQKLVFGFLIVGAVPMVIVGSMVFQTVTQLQRVDLEPAVAQLAEAETVVAEASQGQSSVEPDALAAENARIRALATKAEKLVGEVRHRLETDSQARLRQMLLVIMVLITMTVLLTLTTGFVMARGIDAQMKAQERAAEQTGS